MKNLLIFAFTFVFACSSAQTLVNQSYQTISNPSPIYEYNRLVAVGNGNFLYMDNYYDPGNPSNQGFQLGILNADTGAVGQFNDYNSLHGQTDFGTNLYVHNGYAYATGFTTDSTFTNKILSNTFKIDAITGDTVWVVSENVSGAVQQVPFSVIADDSGYVYTGIAVQTATAGRISVIKYSPVGAKLWQSDYDTIGFSAVPVAMAFSGNNITLTGFIYDSLGTSDFLTYHINRHTGIHEAPKLSANGSGAISHPVGMWTDTLRQTYVGGTSTVSGMSSVFKLVAYDSVFNQLWQTTWGDSMASNQAASMTADMGGSGHTILLGTSPNTSGGTDLVLVRFDNRDGSVIWSRRLSAPDPTKSMTGISATNYGEIYVTGSVYNGSDTDIVTAVFDSAAGNLIWMKTFGRQFGSNDVPYSITLGDDGVTVYVTGRSFGTDSQYVMLKYTQDHTNIAADSVTPSQQWAFYENKGQVIDTGTHQADYVHYYTNTANPRLYVSDLTLSYVYGWRDTVGDTLQRLDLQLVKSGSGNAPNPSPAYYSSEQIDPFLNYYIGGLPSYYENVHGYQRITAKDVYPGIDWQLYSDTAGLRYYYVVNPGGSPSDIAFLYTGADSVQRDTNSLKIYSHYYMTQQLPFTAWQYSGGTASAVSLTLSSVGTNEYAFTVGSYNTSLPLYITMAQRGTPKIAIAADQLKWCTYWGGSKEDYGQSITTDEYNNKYIAGDTWSPDFPVTTISSNSAFVKGSLITKFDENDLESWSTFFGAISYEYEGQNTTAIAYTDRGVFIAGKTSYQQYLPMVNGTGGGLFNSTYFGGSFDIFLARFDPTAGSLAHSTYIGSNGDEEPTALAVDRSMSDLFLVGKTSGTNFPYTNAALAGTGNFYDGSGTGTGFIMEFDKNTALLMSSQFGPANTYISDAKIDNEYNLLITGSTTSAFSTSSPYNITLPSGSSYTQSYPSGASSAAFLAKFKRNPFPSAVYSLYYYSLFGGTDASYGSKICYTNTDDIYMVGHSGCTSFPEYPSSNTCPSSNIGLFISKFSTDGVQQYANLISGSGKVVLGQDQSDPSNNPPDYNGTASATAKREGDIICDAGNNLYILGLVQTPSFSMTFPSVPLGAYSCSTSPYTCVTGQPCLLLEYSPSQTLIWGTYFGAIATSSNTNTQFAGGVTIANNDLYICGTTSVGETINGASVLEFPIQYETGATNVSLFNQGVNGISSFIYEDAFVAKFNLSNQTTGISNIPGVNALLTCYPNPSTGSFTIDMTKFAEGQKQVNVYDELGKTIYSKRTEDSYLTIDLLHTGAGLYFVEVTNNNNRDIAKIIITQ